MEFLPNDQNFIVLGIAGLMIALYLFSVKHEKRMYYVLFLMGTIASGIMLSQVNYEPYRFPITYPFTLAFLYTLGPSYFFYKNRYRFKTYEIWLHYFPALFITAAAGFQILNFPESFSINQSHFLENNRLQASITYIVSDGTLILFYPFHAALYFAGNMVLDRREDFTFDFEHSLSGIAMVLLSPFVFGLAHIFVYNESVLEPFKDGLVFILIGTIPAIAFDLLLQYRNIKKIDAISEGLKTIDLAHVSLYLQKHNSLESVFTSPGFTREDLYKSSGISAEDWDEYMIRKDFSFPSLKKWVRIRIAKQLIQEGYLEKYNVDALSEAVGYRSRTSFYAAFKEIEQISLSEFRSKL